MVGVTSEDSTQATHQPVLLLPSFTFQPDCCCTVPSSSWTELSRKTSCCLSNFVAQLFNPDIHLFNRLRQLRGNEMQEKQILTEFEVKETFRVGSIITTTGMTKYFVPGLQELAQMVSDSCASGAEAQVLDVVRSACFANIIGLVRFICSSDHLPPCSPSAEPPPLHPFQFLERVAAGWVVLKHAVKNLRNTLFRLDVSLSELEDAPSLSGICVAIFRLCLEKGAPVCSDGSGSPGHDFQPPLHLPHRQPVYLPPCDPPLSPSFPSSSPAFLPSSSTSSLSCDQPCTRVLGCVVRGLADVVLVERQRGSYASVDATTGRHHNSNSAGNNSAMNGQRCPQEELQHLPPASVLREIMDMLVTTNLYVQSFEQQLCDMSEQYFAARCVELLAICSLKQYVHQVHEDMQQETSREYLLPSTKERLVEIMGHEMIYSCRSELLSKAAEFVDLVKIRDLSTLGRLYSLFKQTRLLHALRNKFTHCVKFLGSEILPGPRYITTIVPRLLVLRGQLETVWAEAFEADDTFHSAMKDGWEEFINNRADGCKDVAYALAKYCDLLLRAFAKAPVGRLSGGGVQGENETDITGLEQVAEDGIGAEYVIVIRNVLGLFRFLHDQQYFEEVYRAKLAKRLLTRRFRAQDDMVERNQRNPREKDDEDKATSTISVEKGDDELTLQPKLLADAANWGQALDSLEQFILKELKNECGSQFTARMEGMFKDMSTSRTLQKAFNESDEYRIHVVASGIMFEVFIGDKQLWPAIQQQQEPSMSNSQHLTTGDPPQLFSSMSASSSSCESSSSAMENAGMLLEGSTDALGEVEMEGITTDTNNTPATRRAGSDPQADVNSEASSTTGSISSSTTTAIGSSSSTDSSSISASSDTVMDSSAAAAAAPTATCSVASTANVTTSLLTCVTTSTFSSSSSSSSSSSHSFSSPPPSQLSTPNVSYPPSISSLYGAYARFYGTQHGSRSITWLPLLGTAIVKYTKAPTCTTGTTLAYEFGLSQIQALCILIFNEHTVLSLGDIAKNVNIPLEMAHEQLLALTANRQSRLLLRTPKAGKAESEANAPWTREFDPGDEYTVNEHFHSPTHSILVQQVKLKDSKRSEVDKAVQIVEQDRTHQVDALVVRLMKAKKKMKHATLFAEVIRQFPISPQQFKKRIGILIEREYLERDARDPQTYLYSP